MPPTSKHLDPSFEAGGVRRRNGDPPTLPPDAVDRLGELLRGFFSELTAQPVPEHLKRLLDRLDQPRKADHGS